MCFNYVYCMLFSDSSSLPSNFTTMAYVRKLDIIDQVKTLLIQGMTDLILVELYTVVVYQVSI